MAMEGAYSEARDLSNSILPCAGLEKTELRSARLTGAFLQEAGCARRTFARPILARLTSAWPSAFKGGADRLKNPRGALF